MNAEEDEYFIIVQQTTQQWILKARQLRDYEWSVVTPDATLRELRQVIRPRLDELEQLLDQAIMLKNGAVTNAREKTQAAQDEWDKKAQISKHGGMQGQYEGKEERYAWWRLETKPYLDAQRLAERIKDMAWDAEERIRLAYSGLDRIRQDMNSALRELQWEAALERS